MLKNVDLIKINTDENRTMKTVLFGEPDFIDSEDYEDELMSFYEESDEKCKCYLHCIQTLQFFSKDNKKLYILVNKEKNEDGSFSYLYRTPSLATFYAKLVREEANSYYEVPVASLKGFSFYVLDHEVTENITNKNYMLPATEEIIELLTETLRNILYLGKCHDFKKESFTLPEGDEYVD